MNAKPDVDTAKALVEQYVTSRVITDMQATAWQQIGKVIEMCLAEDYQIREITDDHCKTIAPTVSSKACESVLKVADEARGIAAALGARPEHLAAIDRLIAEFKKEQQK